MIRIEAPTLEEAYEKASLDLGCSVSELKSEIIQHPSKGFLGFMSKSAILVVVCENNQKLKEYNKGFKVAEDEQQKVTEELITEEIVTENIIAEEEVLNSFFEEDHKEKRPSNNNFALSEKIEHELKELIEVSCFDIDVIEVDVIDNTALIFIDGEDAALLIGKEGYRYNALSYMLFNWLFSTHNLYIKLEIAEFLTTQQEMIRSYIEPVIEHVNINGKGKTRSLDGILVQIALEQLREAFPNKYVAVKSGRDGKKFILINDFNSRKDG
ncbi:MAG: Jag N-terminal domain-containing protein [Sulfurovum sp.]|nr:Jag N-terminal domain-containing protein [Sulfurovaceae bacterium]